MVTENVKVDRAEREKWAFQHVANAAEKLWGHDASLCILEPHTLQAEIIRESDRTHIVKTPEDFREKMKNPDVYVIFLPQTAMILRATIDQVSQQTPLDKLIIWETDDPS